MDKYKDEARCLQTRLTELRMKKGVSEGKISIQVGKQRTYIQSLSSGRVLP